MYLDLGIKPRLKSTSLSKLSSIEIAVSVFKI